MGYPYNKKYPPCWEKYGWKYSGYKTDARETLFHNFAVQRYDLQFSYKGKFYYCLSDSEYVASCDSHFTEEYQRFDNANQYIEEFEIDGHKLIDLIDELEDVEPM